MTVAANSHPSDPVQATVCLEIDATAAVVHLIQSVLEESGPIRGFINQLTDKIHFLAAQCMMTVKLV